MLTGVWFSQFPHGQTVKQIAQSLYKVDMEKPYIRSRFFPVDMRRCVWNAIQEKKKILFFPYHFFIPLYLICEQSECKTTYRHNRRTTTTFVDTHKFR